jgi:hypothetical protein
MCRFRSPDDERCLVLGENRLLVSKTVALEDTLDEVESSLRRLEREKQDNLSRIHGLERELGRERENKSKDAEDLHRLREVVKRSGESKMDHCAIEISIAHMCERLEESIKELQEVLVDDEHLRML